MKILLLGELSGVHQELAPGLRSLGHEVTIGHSRLAQPGFESDITFFRPPAGAGGRAMAARDALSQLFHAPEMTGFDVVQMITPKFFNWKIHGPMMRYLKRHNRRLVVINTSCSFHFHHQIQKLDYRACPQCMAFDLKSDRCIFNRDDERRAEEISFGLADAIVATHYEYAFALEGSDHAAKLVGIPLPIDTHRHHPLPMPAGDKVRIWYGETRYGFKGSAFILPALDRLQQGPLGDRVEVVRTGRLAFDDYLDFLGSVHIVIDQASSYGIGMNALYALSRGRVTLSGAEAEALDFLNLSAADNPVVNIRPDAAQIHDALAALVERPEALPELGRKSGEYIARYHATEVIAPQYEDLYRRLLSEPGARQVEELGHRAA